MSFEELQRVAGERRDRETQRIMLAPMCSWVHHAFGYDVRCPLRQRAIPGGLFCADCLIRWALAQPQSYFDQRTVGRPA